MNKPLTKKEWEKSVAEAWSTAIEATYKDMIEKAVLEEREACAKVCEDSYARFKELWEKFDYPSDEGRKDAASQCAEAIRARGQA